MSGWEVNGTDEFADWYHGLDEQSQDAIDAAVEQLEQQGPAMGRPKVGEIALEPDYRRFVPLFGRHLKELIPTTSLRVLFTFDPRREAILLVGGDKSGNWKRWYRDAIPEAAREYEAYLERLRKDRLL